MRAIVHVTAFGLLVASATPGFAQTQAAPAAPTDIYHVHLTKAAPGQAIALGKALMQPNPQSPTQPSNPDRFILLRHQEGDDWDYALISHVGQKATVTIPSAPAMSGPELREWHRDTIVAGPPWAEFAKQMGIGPSSKPGGVYVLGFHRAVPGHRSQLQQILMQPPPADAKVRPGSLLLSHLEGGEWQFLTITRYDSWQDFAADQPAAGSAQDAWAEIRQHSAFHRDTIADRVGPSK